MIVSAVVDPSAFGPLGITDELSKREAIAFLHGIIDNGVLLDEPTRALLREALIEVRCCRFDGHSNCLILSVRIERRRSVSCRGRRAFGSIVSTVPS